jgi:TetR/AcrR family transcriptional regulator, tetracycline repressor protein
MTSTPARDTERTRLSKDAVVDRGLAIADAEGLDALTIRRLATELGVTPMALYWHFRSKEALLAGLADRIWAEIDTDVDPAANWPQQLRGMLESLVRVLRAHPCASQLLLLGEKLNSDSALRATETALGVLQRGGFDPAHASEVAKAALWTGLMLVMSAPFTMAGPALTDADRTEMQRRSQIRLALLPPEQYPRLVEAAVPMTACGEQDQDFHYRFGIDLFIAGVQAMAVSATTASATTVSATMGPATAGQPAG